MCQWGDDVIVRVTVPADLSCHHVDWPEDKGIDRCISQIVDALEKGGVKMRSSCCGHFKHEGSIELQDGRTLLVLDENTAAEYFLDRPAALQKLIARYAETPRPVAHR